MNKASEHKEGLRAYKGLVFGLLNIVAVIMVWNDPHYHWFNVISLLAWVFYFLLAFFVAGEIQDERQLNELEMLNKLKERNEQNAREKDDNEENNESEN